MKRIINSLDFHEHNTAVTIGKFDAVHRGHQLLIDAITRKKQEGLTPVVITLHQRDEELFTDSERESILESLGVEVLIDLAFENIREFTAEEFIQKILVERLDVRYFVCGTDFRFGWQRRGDIVMMKQFADALHFEFETKEKLRYRGEDISSSRIQKSYYRGELFEVNEMLGFPVFLTGTVIHGNRIGRTMGCPTANVVWPKGKTMPPNGVYAAKIRYEGQEYFGVANIGVKPTVSGDTDPLIEVNLFDFEGNLYGEELTVLLFKWLRPERKFDSLEDLAEQLVQDVNSAKEYFK